MSVFYKYIVGQCNLSYKDEAVRIVIKNRINVKGESRLQWMNDYFL